MTVRLSLVAAVAENGVIGAEGEMPWHYPEDLKHFRRLTMDSPVIMGRVTFESIVDMVGGPLDGRTNIVLSSTMDSLDFDDVIVAPSVDSAKEHAATVSETVYVIGGASVYEQFLPYASNLIITEVPESPEGDTYFPNWKSNDWKETNRVRRGELEFVTYEKNTT